MKSKEGGLSLIGLLIVASLAGFALLLGFRTVPALTEYFAIKRIINAMAIEGDGGATMADLRRSFERRAQIDDVTSISGADLDISKRAGKVVIEVAYARKVPVVANVSLLIDFEASSAGQQ